MQERERESDHCNNSWNFLHFKRFRSFFYHKSENKFKNCVAHRMDACINFVLIKSHCSQISNLIHRRNSWRNHPISFKYIVRLLFFVSFCFISFSFLWRDCAHYRDDLSEKGHIKYISAPYLVYHCMVERARKRFQ